MGSARLQVSDGGRDAIVDGEDCARSAVGPEAFIARGPHERRNAGQFIAEFMVRVAGRPDVLGDLLVALLQVATNGGATIIREERLLLSHLDETFTRFSVPFTLHEARDVEYRVYTTGQVELLARLQVEIHKQRRSGYPPVACAIDREWKNEREYLDGYLRNVTGVIHVGANTGQERRYYWLLGVDVAWVEAIKEVYEELVDNLSDYDRQRPIHALLADVDGRTFDFRIANNKGASSSVLPFQDHATIFPDIEYVETRTMRGMTLGTMMRREGLSSSAYQALTLDAEGAEAMILNGGRDVLRGFRYIKCEVADFPARTDTPTVAELDAILTEAGFAQLIRRMFARGPDGRGTYWDIVWKRIEPGVPLNEPGVKLPLVAHAQDVAGLEKLPG